MRCKCQTIIQSHNFLFRIILTPRRKLQSISDFALILQCHNLKDAEDEERT